MHCILEGLTKRMIFLTISKKTNEKIIKLLNEQNLIVDFARDFSYPNLLGFKANQFLTFLLYYVYLLEDLIDDEYYCLFLDLRKILKFVLIKNLSINEINNLEYYIIFFMKKFKLIFGVGECSANYHSLIHIPYVVKNFGNLIYINTFYFERYNNYITQNFWGNFNMEFILINTFYNFNLIKNIKFMEKNKNSKNSFILNGLTFNKKNQKKNSYTFKRKNNNFIFEILEIENDLLKIKNLQNNSIEFCKKDEIYNQVVVIQLKNKIKYKEIIFPPKLLN